jgi:hypothetical protein
MFPRLLQEEGVITGKENVKKIFDDPAFSAFTAINVLPLIYDEKKQRCNILVFDYEAARNQTETIVREDSSSEAGGKGRGRKHPVFRFYDAAGDYICEVRYGDAAANALQRGLWTHTRNALKHFDSVTNGWISYSHNHVLVKLFSHSLISTAAGHTLALEKVKEDIERLKLASGL